MSKAAFSWIGDRTAVLGGCSEARSIYQARRLRLLFLAVIGALFLGLSLVGLGIALAPRGVFVFLRLLSRHVKASSSAIKVSSVWVWSSMSLAALSVMGRGLFVLFSVCGNADSNIKALLQFLFGMMPMVGDCSYPVTVRLTGFFIAR